jgi:hypothetical protein
MKLLPIASSVLNSRLSLIRGSRRRAFFAVLGVASLAAVGGSMSGCANGSPPPSISETAYAGPALVLEENAGLWVVVMKAPGAGGSLRLDRVAEGYGFQGVYVTVTDPNPAFSYAATPVEQRLAVSVATRQAIKVFARHAKFTGECESGDAYRPAISADAASGSKGEGSKKAS